MKGSKGIILPILLSLLISIVEAGIFLKAKDPHVIQEAVWLYSNSTAITQIALDVPAQNFLQTIAPLNNVPEASIDGTTGVLYNRDESCSPNTIDQPIPIPFYTATPKQSKVPKIALIKKQGGNCTLVEKIRNAQLEGAIGAIVYDTNEMTNSNIDEDHTSGVPPDSGITIPAYYVNHTIGVELYHQLGKMAGVPLAIIPTYDNYNLTTRISVRISLMPPDNVKATAWELTLLVMLVLLGASIFFSVLMQVYMWKKNERLQGVVERHRATGGDNTSPMGKALLSIARLYQFPTRIVDTLPDEEERKKVEHVLSDEKQREALKKSTALPTPIEIPKQSKSIFGKKKQVKKQTSLPSVAIKIDAPLNSMCVICLEAFKMGDEVRELPCHHEYHTICIDPWLTSKSSECPLCKYDCSDSKTEDTVVADPDGLIAAASVPGLRGMILRPYLRFKANRRNRIGQVGTTTDIEHQPTRSMSQQNNLASPPSPDLRAALRAVEAVESAPPPIETPIATIAAIDAAHHQYDREQLEASNIESTPRQSTATETTAITHNQVRHHLDEEETRNSISTTHCDETDTVHTIASTYNPTLAGGILPDIDVSSISLCSIDLGGLSEDFHNALNNNNR